MLILPGTSTSICVVTYGTLLLGSFVHGTGWYAQ
jgi:hypothetical protein